MTIILKYKIRNINIRIIGKVFTFSFMDQISFSGFVSHLDVGCEVLSTTRC